MQCLITATEDVCKLCVWVLMHPLGPDPFQMNVKDKKNLVGGDGPSRYSTPNVQSVKFVDKQQQLSKAESDEKEENHRKELLMTCCV